MKNSSPQQQLASVLLLIIFAAGHGFAQETSATVIGPPQADTQPTSGAQVSVIPGMRSFAGNPNLLASGVPEIPPELRSRVSQYLNVRHAYLVDTTADGKQILIATRFGSTSQLHLVEQPMGARTQLTFGEEPVAGARFLPGDPQTIFYLQDAGGGEFHQIYRLDRRTGRSTLWTDGKSRHGDLLLAPDGKLMAYSSTARNGKDTDVYLASTETSSTVRPVTQLAGSWSPVDFSPDSKKLLVQQFRAVDDSDLYVVDVTTLQRRQITPAAPKASVRSVEFSADSRSVYLSTDRWSDFNELYQFDLSSPDTTSVPLTRSLAWNVEGVAVPTADKRIAFVTNESGTNRLYYLAGPRAMPQPAPLPSGILYGLRFPQARRAEQLFFSMETACSPVDVWQLQTATGKLTRWTRSEVGGLNPATFVEPELVECPSCNGLKIPAWFYCPRTPAKTRHPVVILFHGGPEGQSMAEFSSFVQLLVNELGIAVLLPNVRGSDGYGKSYLAMDDGVKRKECLNDIGSVLDWIGHQPQLDASRVGVYGGSYGGYMTLCALAFYPERVRAGVDVVGISCLPTFLQNTQAYRRDLRRAEYGDERVAEVRSIQEEISPLLHASRIQGAVFVLQGKNDPRVPQSEAEQIVQAVRASGKDAWYLLALNEGHGFARKENRDLIAMATALFLKEKLLVPGATAP